MNVFSVNIDNTKTYNLSYAGKGGNVISNFDLPKHNIKLAVLNNDVVSFGKQKRNKIPLAQDGKTLVYHRLYSELKNVPNLPCVYCGEPMLSVPNRKKLINDLSTQTGQDLINTIQKNKKFFREHKAKVVEKIIKIAQTNPDDNVEEIFKKLAPQYRSELENEQMVVIRRLNDYYSNAFSTQQEKKLYHDILYQTTQWIKNKDEEIPFKRKVFLSELKKILSLPIFKNKQLVRKIMVEAEKMPKSIESENAFVVKYHRRSAQEIATILVYEAISTIEHIKPQEAGGLTIPQNLSIACARCNNYVRNNMPMDKFIDLHPEVEKNMISNFNAILGYSARQNQLLYRKLSENNIDNENYQRYVQIIKDNEDYKNYISAIAQTYMLESKGKLNLQKFVK